MKVIIDTDPGADDALALIYAVNSRKIDIEAITTVCGNSSLLNTTSNAHFILRNLLNTNIQIYSGAENPLELELVTAKSHGKSGLGDIETKKDSSYINNLATIKILEEAKKSGKDLSLITLGPLTNIARAIQEDNKIMKKIKEIYTMGGAINTYGNSNRVAEFNFYVDPHAASIVFDSGIDLTLVPANICRQVILNQEDIQKLPKSKNLDILKKIISPYFKVYKSRGFKGAVLYDPLTVGVFLNRSKMSTEKLDIKIETSGKLTRGMCVPELREYMDKNLNVNVVTKVDSEFYLNDLLENLRKL